MRHDRRRVILGFKKGGFIYCPYEDAFLSPLLKICNREKFLVSLILLDESKMKLNVHLLEI